MKKIVSMLLAAICVIGFVGCNDKKESGIAEKGEYTAPFTIVQGTEKPYIAHNGIPFTRIGAHLRADQMLLGDGLTAVELEPYFALAAETGLDVLEIPLMWSQIEREKDVYDYSDLTTYLSFAKKYGIYLNLIWYGTLTDGQSHTACFPKYVWSDPKTYTVIKDVLDYGIYGRLRIMKWDDPDLLQRESQALYNAMNEVYAFSEKNDYDPVAEVQLGYGADRFAKWRIEQYDVRTNGERVSDARAAEMVNKYLNELGRAVGYSSYRAITRVEFCEQTAVTNSVAAVGALDYVNMVTPTYLHVISNTKAGVVSFSSDERLSSMPVVNSENYASDIGARNLLATYALGGAGYSAYYLSAPVYCPESPTGALYGRMDGEGKFTERGTRASEYKAVGEMLKKASYYVLNASSDNFAALGMDNRISDGKTQKIFMKNGIAFDYISSDADALGYVISADRSLYVTALADGDISFSRTVLTAASSGTLSASGEWTKTSDEVLTGNNTSLHIEKGKLYRIRYSSTEAADNRWFADNGYSSIKDSIRG